ncbi:MAG: undecaprenyl-diphosphate phosphatase [Clostridia bacterium]|nr:undecaprenyl-diphosphate phosphatase [Clostridia bacterium]
MTIFEAVFYGIIQGIAEFLPISSSGHLAIAQNLSGFGSGMDIVAFNVLLHVGTLLAVVIVYFKDVIELIKAFFTLLKKVFKGNFKMSSYSTHERLIIFLVIATLPIVLTALVDDKIDALSSYLSIVGALLIFNGLVLMISDKISRGNRTLDEMKPKHALLIGVCQMFAVLPGISRSGSTITGGLFSGLDRTQAVRFSFLLSLPAILGASVLKLPDFFADVPDGKTLGIYIVGMIASTIVGICAIKILGYISKKSNFRIFSYYCFAVGALTVAWDIFTRLK